MEPSVIHLLPSVLTCCQQRNSWLAFAPFPSHPFSTGHTVVAYASGPGPALADFAWLVERPHSRAKKHKASPKRVKGRISTKWSDSFSSETLSSVMG